MYQLVEHSGFIIHSEVIFICDWCDVKFCVKLCLVRQVEKWSRPIVHFPATRLYSFPKGMLKTLALLEIRSKLDLLSKNVGSGYAKSTCGGKRPSNREDFFLIGALKQLNSDFPSLEKHLLFSDLF